VITAQQLQGYLPVQLNLRQHGADLSWCFVGEKALNEAFFDDSIIKLLRQPFNQLFRPETDIEMMAKVVQELPCLTPTAFIFHMSRCGSTLLAQMFAASTSNIVISEASAIDKVLYASKHFSNLSVQMHLQWLQTCVLCLGQQRAAAQSRYVVKLDSWHTRHLAMFEQAFPNVPWVFLYRDPLEVLVSNLTQRAGYAIPGVANSVNEDVSLLDALSMSKEQYLASLLAQTCRFALTYAHSARALFVNYEDLPFKALPKILAHFGIKPSPEELSKMHAVSRINVKQPGQEFVSDSKRKQDQADELARHFSDLMLKPLYQQLESLRWRA